MSMFMGGLSAPVFLTTVSLSFCKVGVTALVLSFLLLCAPELAALVAPLLPELLCTAVELDVLLLALFAFVLFF